MSRHLLASKYCHSEVVLSTATKLRAKPLEALDRQSITAFANSAMPHDPLHVLMCFELVSNWLFRMLFALITLPHEHASHLPGVDAYN